MENPAARRQRGSSLSADNRRIQVLPHRRRVPYRPANIRPIGFHGKRLSSCDGVKPVLGPGECSEG
nr:MAG TPA: hypothetical protein [Caudoviricetes sp.]